LLHDKQLLPSRSPDALRHPELDDPWSLRAAALDRRLEAKELAVVLGHIAKHRGFKFKRRLVSFFKQTRISKSPSFDEVTMPLEYVSDWI